MTKNLFILFAFLNLDFATGQVPRKILAEHFTNSYCSVCASRNPGFFNNLNSQGNVTYIGIFPSAPYAACKLSQQNKADNDARTGFYGIYGSTPRVVINGGILPTSANYSSASIFAPYASATSAYSMVVRHSKVSDSFLSVITIKKVANDTLKGKQKLFAVLAEDTVFYTGGNGESRHYNVARKSLFGAAGITVTMPVNLGDSVSHSFKSAINGIWNENRMLTIAALQDSASRSLIQSATSKDANPMAGRDDLSPSKPVLKFSNPVYDKIILFGISGNFEFDIYDLNGKLLLSGKNQLNEIDVENMQPGLYSLSVFQHGKQTTSLFVKQ